MKINLKLKNGETVDITDNCDIATRHIFDTIVSLANEQGADICTIEFVPAESDDGIDPLPEQHPA